LVEADGLPDMIEKIGYYLNNPENRESIAQEGYNEAISKYTYFHRANELAEIFHTYPFDKNLPSVDKSKCRKAVIEAKLLYLYVNISGACFRIKKTLKCLIKLKITKNGKCK